MYSPKVRLALVLLSGGMAIWAFARGAPTAWLFVIAAATFAVGYWRNASVWLAWRAYRRRDIDTARRLIDATPAPRRLAAQQRAYFELLQGELKRHAGNPHGAREHFEAAAAGRLRSAKDRAFAYSRLAEAALTAGDVAGTREAIARARALSPPAFIEVLLRDLEDSLSVR